MKTSKSGSVVVYVDAGQGFTPESATIQQINSTLTTDVYRFSIPTSRVVAVRLDPIDKIADINIETIKLNYDGYLFEFKGKSLDLWEAVYDLQQITSNHEEKYLALRSTGVDPQLYFKLPQRLVAGANFSHFLIPQTNEVWWLLATGALLVLLALLPQAWQVGGKRSDRLAIDVFALLIPLLLFWIINHNALDNHFAADDPCYLNYLGQVDTMETFIDPDKASSRSNFTPLFNLSFGIDFHLFALEAENYYWHQLISYCIAISLVFGVLRYFLPPLLASLILSVFVVSVTSVDAAHYLMERHYVEGLGLAALALLCFLHATRNSSYLWAVAGSAAYLSASLAKELYVPLVGLLPFLVVASPAIRWRMWLPYLGAAIVYILWRSYMLGGDHLVHGYGESGYVQSVQAFLSLPYSYQSIMRWPLLHWLAILIGLAVFLGTMLPRLKTRLLNSMLWAGAALVPLIPVLNMLASRYVFVVTLLLYVAIGFGIYYRTWHHNPVLSFGFWLLLLGTQLQAEALYRDSLHNYFDQASAEGRFLLYANQGQGVLINPLPHCLKEYLFVRDYFKLPGQPPAVASSICTAQYLYPEKTEYYIYHKQSISRYLPDMLAECLQRDDMALSLALSYQENSQKLVWNFGPYSPEQGKYFIVMTTYEVTLPPSGETLIAFDFPVRFQLKYVDNSGWQTNSPFLVLDTIHADDNGNIQLNWQRLNNNANYQPHHPSL